MIRFRCPHCQKVLAAPAEAAGKCQNCPSCGQSTQIPFADQGNAIQKRRATQSCPAVADGHRSESSIPARAADALLAQHASPGPQTSQVGRTTLRLSPKWNTTIDLSLAVAAVLSALWVFATLPQPALPPQPIILAPAGPDSANLQLVITHTNELKMGNQSFHDPGSLLLALQREGRTPGHVRVITDPSALSEPVLRLTTALAQAGVDHVTIASQE